MSDILQSGHHPDADQLSAFVEHALPPHEQEQTLAHLSVCPDCRSVVALSLTPVETSPEARPEPVRRPWFSGWNLAWAGAAGLAGLMLAVVHIHNVANARNGVAAPSQIAVTRPSTPFSPLTTAPAASKPAPTATSQPQSSGSRAATTSSRSSSTRANDQSLAALPIQNRNPTDMKQNQLASPGGVANDPRRDASGSQASADKAADQLQQRPSKAAAVNPGSQSTYTVPAATPSMSFKQAEAAAAPPPTPAVVSAVNRNVQATAAAPLATLSTLNSRAMLNKAKSVVNQHPLPSQLPVISVASNASQILAVDTRNAVFFSDDGGNHWKAVPAKWQGHAVKVDLASTQPTLRNLVTATGGTQPSSNFSAGPAPLAAPLSSAALTGFVTDSSGAAISGASVSVISTKTPNFRAVKTDITGHYLVDDLAPGSYQIEAQAIGFNKQQLAVTLAASQQGLANLTLPVGAAAETITVDAAAVAVEPAEVARKKTSQPLPQIPLLPVFEITTDTGEHWTSIDGQTWNRK